MRTRAGGGILPPSALKLGFPLATVQVPGRRARMACVTEANSSLIVSGRGVVVGDSGLRVLICFKSDTVSCIWEQGLQ